MFMRRTAILAISAAVFGLAASAAMAEAPAEAKPDWLDRRLSTVDRTWFSELTGHAPPAFRDDLHWVDSEPLDWEGLRGRIVVLQSWTSRATIGRMWMDRVSELMEDFGEDVVVIGLHTPQGAEKAHAFLERKPMDIPIAIDSSGAMCDDLGFYKRATNIVVDRNGAVRYAGLTPRGLREAISALVDEPHDPSATAATHPAYEREIEATVIPFPEQNTGRLSALDKQGDRVPDQSWQSIRWLSGKPSIEGKVVLVDFWATWCGPCRASIPKLNEMAEKYAEDVAIIGLSDEPPLTVERFMQENGGTPLEMRYTVATDPDQRMESWFRVRGIPHLMVMSPDGIVRWQGHPLELERDLEMLEQIIAASETASSVSAPARRWERELTGS